MTAATANFCGGGGGGAASALLPVMTSTEIIFGDETNETVDSMYITL